MANKANSVVVVDAGIEAPLQLAAGLAFDAEILILPYDRDGVAHIAAALQARPETTDVYVVAHGAPGQLFLGNTELSLSTLPRYGDRLRQWTANTKIQNIHFYGCRVAAGDAGTEFLSAIHSLTDANIAASTHLLGHADQGGDWTLDAFWGEVERRSLLTADAIATYPGSLANDIENATPITPGGPLQDGNADADAQLGEPLHDPTGFGQDVAGQILANDSVWWSWTANIDGLVNINTIGSDIGTVLAVYSGPVNATSADFGSFSLIDTDFTAAGGATTGASVNFNATNGVTYYFAVDGTGFQQTTGNDTGITIELDVPPVITPAQLFTIDENSAAATPLDGGGQVAVTGTVDTWAITAGNLDNDGDGNAAFAIDNTGVISVNDADDLDFERFPNTYQLTVKASDTAGFSDSEAVFVQVKDVNEAPEITSLSALGTVNEGETVTLTGQVSDPDAGDTQKVTIDWTNDGATADDITVIVDSNGMFSASNTYADDFQGEISVTVEDAAGVTGTTDPVTRNISVLNVAPEITPSIPLNFTLAEDGSQPFFLTATDPSSVDVLTWSVGSPSNGGSLTAPVGNDATQFFTYTPDLNFNGTETFEIQVRDDDGGLDTVQFNVTVTPEADAPTGLTLSASDNDIDEGDTITLSGTFQDPDVNDDFTVTIDWGDGTTPTELTTAELSFNSTTNTYSFNATHEFLANDDVSVVVTVRDGDGLTDIASEAITINNLPPVVDPASTFLSTDEDVAGTIDFTATDTTATNFTWKIIDGPDNGTVSFANPTGANQTLTYTPDADFFGGDNIIIGVSDGDDITAVNVAVIVKSVNDDPTNLVVTPDDDTIDEGDTVTLSGTFDDVDNSTEPLIDDTHSITIDWGDGTAETFTEADLGIFTDTDQGTVSFDNLTHIYADEGSGTYTIEVTVTDALGATVNATREIQVNNVAPVISAPPDTTATPLAATEDTPIDFTVKATDVGVEDILVWSEIDAPDNGTLTFGSSPENGSQNVTYTPNADFNGTDTFTLQVSDGDGGFESIEYTVNVAGANDPPTLLVGNFVVTEDQELPINRSLLDAIDDETTNPANLTFTITGPGAGSFLVNGTAATTFTLADIDNGNVSLLYENANDLGVDGLAFTVTVADDGAPALEASQFVQIPPESFTAQNDDPVFVDQDGGTLGIQLGDINVTEDGPSVLINNSIIAATDEETADGDLSFVVNDVEGGNFLLDGSETNTFTQAEINAGRVRFINDGSTTDPSYTITVSDGQGGSATLTGGGTVIEANDAPEILFNSFTIVEDELLNVTPLILNATDEDDTDGPGQLTFTITGPDANSFSVTSFTLQDVIDGNVTFLFKNEANLTDAGGNPIGPDFTITVADDDGASATEAGNVIDFDAVNDLPILNDFIDSDPATDGVQFEFDLKEGIPQPLNAGDIDATDEETNASNLIYTVTDVTGGTFFVAGVETNTFTQAQLNAGNLVFFVDDGTFTGAANDSLPAFKLTVDDGEGGVVETTLTATFTDVVASAPVITTNTFDITEESQFQVTTAILDAEDVDTLDADLTFTITGDASTAFLVDAGAGPVANNTFTREDLLNNKVFFNYEGEDTPEFTITVSDGDVTSADATADGNVIDYDPVNDVPTLVINVGGVNLDEGGSFFITDTIFTFTDAEFDATPSLQDAEQIIYTYTATNGFFADAAGNQITNFTHADVLAGNVVQFIQDGTPAAPSFTVTVADNGFTLSDGRAFPTSESATATVLTTDFGAFNATNDAPTIGLNQFEVVEGQPLTINTSVLQIKDEETLNSANLTIEITSAAANAAEVLAAFSQTTFTYQDVVLGNVTFTYDGEVEPEFEITVTDDGRLTPAGAPTAATESTTVTANILSFDNTNDAPVFVDQDGGTPGIQLGAIAVTEDSFVAITTALISATDVDLPVGADLTYTVSNVVGGNFTLNGIEVANITTTFTQNDIESGLVFFVNNGENTDDVPVGGTPNTISYDIQVSDDDPTNITTASGTGTIAAVDDAPSNLVNDFAVTEGVQFQVTTAQLSVTDADTLPSDIDFTIAGTDAASFNFSNDGGVTLTPDTDFTLQDIIDGNIFFLYEGEGQPEFTITVNDQSTTPVDLTNVAGDVDFTPTNDVPALTVTIPGATISEGGFFFIDTTVFALTDAEFAAGQQTADQLVYTFTAENGFFADANGDALTTPFTQADVIAGNQVQFIQDGSEDAPSFSVTLNDNGFTFDGNNFPESKEVTVDVESPTDFAFVNINDVPELIVGNDIEVDEGQTVTITQANLNASDIETNAFDLTFVVSEITNGFISTNGGLTFEDATGGDIEFTVQDVLQSQVIFKHDDSNEFTVADLSPSFKVQVRDIGGDAGTGLTDELSQIVTIDVTLNDIDDTPVLEETFNTADDGVPFSINEGQTLLMTSTNINALDPDTPPEQLVYTVTNSVGGKFAFTQNPDGSPAATPIETNTFTQAQVNDGLVVYVHGGDNTNPSYNLKVSDGNSSDTELYTPTLVTENDAPEIKLNTLAITEDTTVSITTLNLQANDEETGPANLTYSVSNLTNGQFLLNGNVITDSDLTDGFDLTDAFTQQDVIDQLVSFQYEGFGDAPTYTLTVTDDGTGSQTGALGAKDSDPSPVTLVYTPVNDAPTASDLIAPADFGIFDVTQGGVTILTKDDILVVDEEDYRLNVLGDTVLAGSPTRIVFTVDEVQNGFFSDGSTEIDPVSGLPVLAPVTEFTQDDINQGVISFIHDGSNDAPRYTLTANDQGLQVSIDETLPSEPFTFKVDLAGNFTNANDAPVLGNNELVVEEGVTNLLIGPANLSATDIETNAFDLTFNIADITNGFFTVVGPNAGVFGEGQADTTGSFTYEDVIVGNVTFTHDGTEDEPTYSVTVTDQVETGVTGPAITTTPPQLADITFNRVNDQPTLIQADGTTALEAIDVNEGGSAPVTLANIDAIDEAGETPAADLIFSVSEVSGGSFIDIAGNITGVAGQALMATDTFTRDNIQNGDLLFENDLDSNDPPTYRVTVTDVDALGAKSAFLDFIGTLTATNDVPQQVTVATIALTEGEPFTLDDSVLEFVDEESAPADLTYTVNATNGGDFFLSSDLINPLASFTQAQVNAGEVIFVDDGLDDAPPTFSLELADQGIPSDATINTKALTDADFAVADNFIAVNDVPMPVDMTIPEGDFALAFPLVTENTSIEIVSTAPVDATEFKIAVTDEESPAADLKYTVVDSVNGFFTLNGTQVSSFTQADIDNAAVNVEFVPQGDQAPTFTLKLEDNNGGAGANVLTQAFAPEFELANEAPMLINNTLSPIEGDEVVLTQDNLSASDREDAVTELTFQITNVVGGSFFLNGVELDTDPTGGLDSFTITQVSLGELTFKDDGLDDDLPSYDVIVIDSDGLASTPAAATIDDSQFPVDNAPEITTAAFSLTEGQSLELDNTILDTTDRDTDDADLVYTVTGVNTGTPVAGGDFFLTEDVGGTVTSTIVTTFTQEQISDGAISFKPDGSDTPPSFKITVTDGTSSDSVTLTTDVGGGIDFTPVNDPPVVVDDAFTTDEDTTLTNLALTANDTDDSGTTLTITAIDGQTSPVTTTGGAEVTIAGSAINYNPGNAFNFLAVGESVTDTFTYTVDDNDTTNAPNNQTATGTVTITIEGKNDAPIANADIATAFENGDITITVLANDSDPDTSDTLSIGSVNTAGTTGVVTIDGNAINYDPTGKFTLANGVTATDTFSYVVDDGNGGTQVATVTVTVTGVNDLPIAVDDSGVGFETDDNQVLMALDLLANDDDPDNDTIGITQLNSSPVGGGSTITLASGAELTLNFDGTVKYDPTTSAALRGLSVGQTQTETFTYTIEDANGGTDTATASIVVNGVNEAPTLANNLLNFTTTEGTPIPLDVLVAAGADDVDLGDTLTIESVTAGSFGIITNNGTSLTYTPGQGLLGGQVETENLTYTVSDGQGGTVTGQITIDVTGINDPPIAVADSGAGFVTNESTAFTTTNVLANDFDPEGGVLTLQSVDTSGVRGLIINNGNGTFTYDPNGVFNALPVNQSTIDTFSYTISDDQGATATTNVSIIVNGQLSSFLDFEKQLKLQNPAAIAPGDNIGGLPLAQLYDEAFYLSQNTDVAALVAGGVLSSGYQHFVSFGINEGRNPSVLYDEAFYLSQNPLVANAVANGSVSSGLAHFLNFGHIEGRDPSAFFDQSDYLLNNPSVANAVNNGSLASGFQHYVLFGVDENRLPDLSLFDAQFYLANNSDLVGAGITNATAYDHFVAFGQFERRQPSAAYSEASYLALQPDIAGGVSNGSIPSGFQHFQQVGRFEGRFVFPV